MQAQIIAVAASTSDHMYSVIRDTGSPSANEGVWQLSCGRTRNIFLLQKPYLSKAHDRCKAHPESLVDNMLARFEDYEPTYKPPSMKMPESKILCLMGRLNPHTMCTGNKSMSMSIAILVEVTPS